MIILSLSLIILISCSSQKIICKQPYIEYKSDECCLDKNANNICDDDENEKEDIIQVDSIIPKVIEGKTLEGNFFIGFENAPIIVTMYGQYGYWSARFHRLTYSKIKEEYISTGKIKFIVKDYTKKCIDETFCIDAFSVTPVEVMRCAGEQDKYWEVRDKILRHPRWETYPDDETVFTEDELIEIASQIEGVNKFLLESCVGKGIYNSQMEKDTTDAINNGVQGTPGFLINGKLISGAQSFEVFKEIIDEQLNKNYEKKISS